MKLLSRMEEIILVAIWRLGEEAYGLAIRREVIRVTGEEWALGAIYPYLGRLLQAGYVRTSTIQATPERGGRHKILYRLTDAGRDALAEVHRIGRRTWDGISIPALRKPV